MAALPALFILPPPQGSQAPTERGARWHPSMNGSVPCRVCHLWATHHRSNQRPDTSLARLGRLVCSAAGASTADMPTADMPTIDMPTIDFVVDSCHLLNIVRVLTDPRFLNCGTAHKILLDSSLLGKWLLPRSATAPPPPPSYRLLVRCGPPDFKINFRWVAVKWPVGLHMPGLLRLQQVPVCCATRRPPARSLVAWVSFIAPFPCLLYGTNYKSHLVCRFRWSSCLGRIGKTPSWF